MNSMVVIISWEKSAHTRAHIFLHLDEMVFYLFCIENNEHCVFGLFGSLKYVAAMCWKCLSSKLLTFDCSMYANEHCKLIILTLLTS